jgi:predicted O-methyltransferase YrrM
MNWKYFDSKFEYEEMFDDACWPWTGHRYFAYDLIRNLKPEVVVELGTHKGTSFYAFSQGAKDENLSTKLFAVDTWEGDEHAGFYGDDIYNEVQDIIKKYYGQQQVQLLRKTFDAALSDFSDHSIDILHIDGLHTYEAVKHDFDSWLAKVKINGIILFHDIYISRGDFGVYKFWDELKAKYKTIEFHQSYGLGVLFLEEEKYDWIIKNGEDIARYYSFMAEDKKNERIMKKFKV